MRLENEANKSVFRLGFGTYNLTGIGASGRMGITEQEFQDMIHTAYNNEVNFFDVAPSHCAPNCAPLMGEALKGVRDQVWLGGRVPKDYLAKPDDLFREVDKTLAALDTDYLDYYYVCSSVNPRHRHRWDISPEIYDGLISLKKQGVIHHLSFSTGHNSEKAENIIDTAYRHEGFDTMLTFYSPLYTDMKEALSYSKSLGFRNFISAPFLPWKLDAQLAYRYAWNNTNVDCLIVTSYNMEALQTNLDLERRFRFLSSKMEEGAWVEITKALHAKHALENHSCTNCNNCMPCPKGIRIPLWIQLCKEGLAHNFDKESMQKLTEYSEKYGDPLQLCDQCKRCVERDCPQKFPIPRYMRPDTIDPILSSKTPEQY